MTWQDEGMRGLKAMKRRLNGEAEALVTYNIRDFEAAGERFGIPVIRPGELLRKVRR